MNRNRSLIFTRVLYILFAIETIIIIWIAYKDIDSSIAFKFGIGYILLTLFLLLYIPLIAIFNLRKFKWAEIKKRVAKFIALFILFSTINYISSYVIRDTNKDLLNVFSGALGLAFGLSFIDVILLKKKDN
ncbi:hypothetical protein [Clostridium sp.]|uniref:hypothetical protein n=1 Tax=Clostridium sp. TaxID=1506 RepID=UPI002FCB3702